MAKPVDLELKRAFTELQLKMIETSGKIQFLDAQLDLVTRILQHVDFTLQEIVPFPSATKTYETVGRMFLLSTMDDVRGALQARVDLLTGRTIDLENTKQYLERNLKESEDNIREMVEQRKAALKQNDAKSNK